MKILITSPRAPVTIEWIKIAKRSGHSVILVDSLDFPIGRYFCKTIPYYKITSPGLDFERYQEQMLALLQTVDWVIPTCEDIFYLAKLKPFAPKHVVFFMPEPDLLLQLHHKYDFSACLNNAVKWPKTRLITAFDQLQEDAQSILKPVYSRFGRDVIRGVHPAKLATLAISPQRPWVQQTFIQGKALCNYALCFEGELIAHAVYQPRYLLNQAAATYFEAIEDDRLLAFTRQFAREHHYTGQVAFDFIDDGRDVYVLECNPRATSGLHLLAQGLQFDAEQFSLSYQSKPAPACRVGASLPLLFGLKALRDGQLKTLLKDYRRARDVLAGLPFYAQWLSFYEMLARAIRYRKPLTSSTTFDIEYDGEVFR